MVAMKNQVQLISYADRFGDGTLTDLQGLPEGPLRGLSGGPHQLPFFDPIDGADAGFDPSDHTKVDARFGDWGGIRQLAGSIEVLADVIVNHIMVPDDDLDRLVEIIHGRTGGESRRATGLLRRAARRAVLRQSGHEYVCTRFPAPGAQN
jgi:hypothetical protein